MNDADGNPWCEGRPSDAVIAAILATATDAQLQPVIIAWPGSGRPDANAGIPLRQASPTQVGYWIMGHRDCKHSGPLGQAAKTRMLQLAQEFQGMTYQGVTQTPGTYTPAGIPTGYVPPNTGASGTQGGSQQTSGTPTSGAPGGGFCDKLGPLAGVCRGTAGFFKGIVGGALSGANQAANAGGTASQASSTVSALIPILALAVIVWLIVRD